MEEFHRDIEKFRRDIEEFREMTRKFYRKEITVPEYKAFSGGFGSYAQRGGELSMLRLRLAGGEINQENLKFIADSIQKYRINLVHLTTCQTIQLHNLTEQDVCTLVGEALDHGIITRGGGGDFPRNVMCSPLSGVEEGECFDVLPFAKEAADYLLGFIKTVKLPRKLKVCFSNNAENITHATFRDLGFVAKENGMFDVYAAGGLGIKPKMGILAAENIKPAQILYCIKTMVDVFTKYGNYEKRAASRSRFLQDTLGVDGLKKVFLETLAENLAGGNLDIDVKPDVINKRDNQGYSEILEEHPRVIRQKQQGLYAVSFHPVGGVVEFLFFQKLQEAVCDMQDVKVRLSPDQGMYVINLTAEEAKKILELTEGGAETAFERSTACIGAEICQVGIGKSQALLEACVKRVRKEHFKDGVLPAIHISGCPSSCSAHQTAVIGLRGGKKPTEDGPKYAFAVYEDGCALEGEEQFGTELGVMLEDDIPEFFVELGKTVSKEGLTYKEFKKKYPDKVKEIAEKFL